MKQRSHALALIGAFFLLAFAPLHAVLINWIGGHGPEGHEDDAAAPENWSAPLAGNGTDDAFFGVISNDPSYVVLPLFGPGFRDVTFGDTGRHDYIFDGTGFLPFNGNLHVTTGGGNVTFTSTLDIQLSNISHTVDIIGGVTVTVNADIRGPNTGPSNASSILKTGDGTLVLNGANQFHGGVIVNAGTLQLGSSSHLQSESTNISNSPVGTGTLTLLDGPTLGVTPSAGSITLHNDIDLGAGPDSTIDTTNGDLSLLGVISGGGELTKIGSGTLTLNNGDSDFSGGVTVSAGTLRLGASSTYNVEWVSNGPVGTGTLKLYNNTTLGLADDASCITLDNAITLDSSCGFVTVNLSCSSDLTLAGTISGASGLVKEGGGTLTLSNDNTFGGGLYVNGGTVNLEDDHATGHGALVFNGSNATVNFNTSSPTIHGLAGESCSNTIYLSTYTTLTIDQDNNTTYAGTIHGDSFTAVVKAGSGALTLSGDNTFGGGLIVSEGTLLLGSSSDDLGITQGPVGTGALELQSNTTLGVGSSEVTLHNPIHLNNNFDSGMTIDVGGEQSLALYGVISGSGPLTKTGNGELFLSGSNTYTGNTILADGELYINSSSALGNLANSLIVAPVNCEVTLAIGTAPTISTPIEIQNGRLNIEVDGSTVFSGVISGPGGLIHGARQLELSGLNTFSGGTTVTNQGEIKASNNSALGTGPLHLDPGADVRFTTSAPHIGSLSGGEAYIATEVNDSSLIALAPGSTLTVNQVGNSAFAGKIAGTSGASVNASLTKAGAGTLTLSGASNYSGTTTISAGKLVAGANAAFGTSTVVINGGQLGIAPAVTFGNQINLLAGTLAGNYTFTTPQTLGAGVTLSPGNSPGTMTFAAGYAPTDGVTTNIEINAATDLPGTSSDLIAVTGGTLNLSGLSTGGYTLNVISLDLVNNPGPVSGLSTSSLTSWTIFTSANPLTTFSAGQFTINQTGFVDTGIFTLTQSGNNIMLNFTPVPEPSTYALMALGLGFIGLTVWRKRRA